MNSLLVKLSLPLFFGSGLLIPTEFAFSQSESILINKKTASRFIDRNRDHVLEYQCKATDFSVCAVVCSSGGNNYIKADNVRQAFYSERKSSVNGSVTGYNLVVDVAGSNEAHDIWATLQIESSCLFKGLTPKL